MTAFAFDRHAMQQRRQAYFTFARETATRVFRPDGTYQPETEDDSRISYWLYPALISGPDAQSRAFANTVYAAAPKWDQWDIFQTSVIATHLVREREHMTPELVARSENHLSQLVDRDGGRSPSSGANDYVFHGYNDNMPSMAVRALILAGDVLDRKDYTDHGLFKLEGLCAHFQRRGLLSEHSSSTYTPITLVALADVAECSTNAEARDMAAACCNRIILDIFGHWHQHVGGMGGTQNRAYTADKQDWLSVANALMWYLTGSTLCCDPIETLRHWEAFEGHGPHGRCYGFTLAQYTEIMVPAFDTLSPDIIDFCAAPRVYPYEILATSDSGPRGSLSGACGIQNRAWHQPHYALATQSQSCAGHMLSLRAVLSPTATPESWKDRVAVWHQLQHGEPDQGDLASHQGLPPTEIDNVHDHGHHHIVQKRGSALVLGAFAPSLLDKEVDALTFNLLFNTVLRQPDETVAEGKWTFIRFGDVYVGVRMAGLAGDKRIEPKLVTKNGYLRVSLPLIEGKAVHLDQAFRQWCVYGYCFEIAAKEECGSFKAFRESCEATTWEYALTGYRNSRYCGRHGELQILDSVVADTIKFMAIDGEVESIVKLAATGLDATLTSLFPDGHRVKQRRLNYNPDFIGSPFYDVRADLLESS
ncbi:MAG: hypothetical protein HQ523_06445 [Lentisphaerae bacterium]|nr:hypothetical protein [Lentisphaerota bacterium]